MKSHEDHRDTHNSPEEFIEALAKLEFKPARWDAPGARQFDLRNQDGHVDVRVCIDYEGEDRPLNISLLKFDGRRSRSPNGKVST